MLVERWMKANSGQSFPANKDLITNVRDHLGLNVSPCDLWDSFIKHFHALWCAN